MTPWVTIIVVALVLTWRVSDLIRRARGRKII